MQKKISDIPSVRVAVETLLSRNITEAVLSPGSRNAPFMLSFDAMEAFRCTSIVDERSAAFVALGMAQQKGQPVILNCTSGSAVLNYAPAIAEAYYQQIPLVVITADRPSRWIDQGEGQSIRQPGVLSNVVAGSFSLSEEQDEEAIASNRQVMNRAVDLAISMSQPVHINVPLDEPLYNVSEWNAESVEFRESPPVRAEALSEAQKNCWKSAKRIMIVVAQHNQDWQSSLERISQDPRVAILTETTGNTYLFGAVACIDRTLETFLGNEELEAEMIPDLLITIGENIVSKKLKAVLRKHKSLVREHWHIGRIPRDTFEVLSATIQSSPQRFLSDAIEAGTPELLPDMFKSRWSGLFFKAEQAHEQFLESVEWSDLKVFQCIDQWIPDGWDLQMGNSSVVRYIQLFNQIRGVRYFGNRGVSGIEGCTSTAVGAAIASERPTLLVSGDHAFRYDANGLSVNPLPPNLKVVVINNEGGSIFNIIDGPSRHASSAQFIEHHTVKSVEGLVKYHGAAYLSAKNAEELQTGLEQLFFSDDKGCAVLEVFTPRKRSPEVLKSYFGHIRNSAMN